MLTAFLLAALLQAAVPPQQRAEHPSALAGRAWGDCVKARLDSRMSSGGTPETLVNEAFGQCRRQENAIRAAIAAEAGDEVARLNVERIRNGGRALFLAYVQSRRGQAASRPDRPS
jgi:hypothetical protein